MPPLYKEGLYWLILLAITAAAYGVLAIFLGPIRACGAFGLFGLAGFQPLLYRKRGKTVVWDERDTRIFFYANNVGFGTVWLVFTSLLMGVWFAVYSYGGHSTISVHVLPNLLMIGFIVAMTARAVAIVVLYHNQDADKGK
jgi:hypothetical protein